jgi:drug/metabolite transporter (DMT)-like permease
MMSTSRLQPVLTQYLPEHPNARGRGINRLSSLPPAQTLLYQLSGAFALLLPAALLMGQTTFHSTPMVWAGFAFQSVLVSFTSFLIWVWLLRHYLASRLGVLSFMTPLFGVLLGAWLLNETIEFSFLVGAGLVLAGVVLVNGYDWLIQLVAVRSGLAPSKQRTP